MKMSVCVDALWPAGKNKDFYEGMKAAAGAGAKAIEFWGWWNKDITKIDGIRKETGLAVSAFCTRFISLVDASSHEAYLTGLMVTIEIAKKLECETIITQVGSEIEGMPRSEQHRNLVEGLKRAAQMLEKSGQTLVFEPLNTTINHKGYYLYSSDEAAQITDEVASPHVKMLFDIYHQQIMEGNITARIERYIEKIGHMHCAGVPGRHELESCELNYDYLFKRIEEAGYRGYMALELFTDHPEAEISRWCK